MPVSMPSDIGSAYGAAGPDTAVRPSRAPDIRLQRARAGRLTRPKARKRDRRVRRRNRGRTRALDQAPSQQQAGTWARSAILEATMLYYLYTV
jgi:hypothetical protein